MPDFHQGLVKRTRRNPFGGTPPLTVALIFTTSCARHAVAIHDGTRLYAIDAHFQEIAKHTSLMLYRPGYGGSFNEVDDG